MQNKHDAAKFCFKYYNIDSFVFFFSLTNTRIHHVYQLNIQIYVFLYVLFLFHDKTFDTHTVTHRLQITAILIS